MVNVFLLILILAGDLLVWDARTGNLEPSSRAERWFRSTLFFLAAAVGGAIFFRAAPSSFLLAAALLPVTLLSLFRCIGLTRVRWNTAVPLFSLVVALILSISVSMSMLPDPLDQRVFIEKIFMRGGPDNADTIDPAGRRSSRV